MLRTLGSVNWGIAIRELFSYTLHAHRSSPLVFIGGGFVARSDHLLLCLFSV
jgi:hypothetical protein